jgi:CDP-paratose 2-epimerase
LQRPTILITGGAGFVGTNVARSYLADGSAVHILDNLGRPGVEGNVAELQRAFPGRVFFTKGDVRDRSTVEKALEGAHIVYHLAAQVAVTTSLADPISDFETNLLGTVHLLEGVRRSKQRPSVLFTSTNKVYGRLETVPVGLRNGRYEPVDEALAAAGINESQSLAFLSPYGCSKGSADQYVLDYARSYGIAACVFRMSCIYGPYQLGSEDQGWVAHFLRQALKGEPVCIYGDGRQVRDLLFVDDLVRGMRMAHSRMDVAAGQAFNMGGGRANSASLLELLDEIAALTGSRVDTVLGPERLADQRWFVADASRFASLTGWKREIGIREGLRRLHSWYMARPELIAQSEVQVV